MKIALTGGIGCGKSTALKAFQKLDFATFSADALGHGILSEPETVAFVVEQFGAACAPGGEIDRARLAEVVFNDPAARERLEKFMHPRIEAAWCAGAALAEAQGKHCVVEIPLLFEKNLEAGFDKTLCLVCSEAVQLERLEKRGLPREQAKARIAAQMPLEEKMRRADVCLFNDGAPEFLEDQLTLFIRNFLN